jgi:hypothetical protein
VDHLESLVKDLSVRLSKLETGGRASAGGAAPTKVSESRPDDGDDDDDDVDLFGSDNEEEVRMIYFAVHVSACHDGGLILNVLMNQC